MAAPEVPDEVDEEPELDVVPDPDAEPLELAPDPDVLLALGEELVNVPLMPEDPRKPVDPAAPPVPTVDGITTRVELVGAPATTGELVAVKVFP